MALRFFRMLPGWEARIERASKPSIERITTAVLKRAKINMASHIVTGALFRSVHQQDDRVYVGTGHWTFIEYGTRRHVIRAPKGKALKVGGKYVKKVNHPGNREYAPMRNALEGVFIPDTSRRFASGTFRSFQG